MTKSRNIRPPLVRWTDAEHSILVARYPNEKTEEIAKSLGRSVASVHGRAAAFGIKKSIEFLSSPLSGRTTGAIGKDSRFKNGLEPWNKGLNISFRGRSLETQFKQGMKAHNKLPVGSITIRREAHTGRARAWVKISEPNSWRQRAVLVWEQMNGPIPDGFVIHHRDRNSLNDSPDNLQALTREEHAQEHSQELQAGRKIHFESDARLA